MPDKPTTETHLGFTLQIGSSPNMTEIPLDMTLPPKTADETKYEYTNEDMKWTKATNHVPNTKGSKPSTFQVDVGAFLSWVASTLSGGKVSKNNLPQSLQSLKIGVDYLLLQRIKSSKQVTAKLSVTLLNGDKFATFQPIEGLEVSASSPYISVSYEKTGT